MRKYLLIAAAALLLAPTSAFAWIAGFQGTVNNVKAPGNMNPLIAEVGDSFNVAPPGIFTSWTENLPGDPQLLNADLAKYRFFMDGTVMSVTPVPGGATVHYDGNYRIWYDNDMDSIWDTPPGPNGDWSVSYGTLSMDIVFNSMGVGSATGHMAQLTGPEHPVFYDFGTAGWITFAGTYAPNPQNPAQGTFSSDVTGGGITNIPEPGTLALLGLGVLPLIRRRK